MRDTTNTKPHHVGLVVKYFEERKLYRVAKEVRDILEYAYSLTPIELAQEVLDICKKMHIRSGVVSKILLARVEPTGYTVLPDVQTTSIIDVGSSDVEVVILEPNARNYTRKNRWIDSWIKDLADETQIHEGEIFRQARRLMGYTYEDMCFMVNSRAIHKYESGEQIPSDRFQNAMIQAVSPVMEIVKTRIRKQAEMNRGKE